MTIHTPSLLYLAVPMEGGGGGQKHIPIMHPRIMGCSESANLLRVVV
jgi:hypothetical protein